jgi:hypothetical protein
MVDLDRRAILTGLAAAAGTGLALERAAAVPRARAGGASPNGPALPSIAPFRTPYKLQRRILTRSGVSGSFDRLKVDCPFVFESCGRYYLTYVGFDGIGYQTGLAESDDLEHWRRAGLILRRDPKNPVIRYNIAMMSILREDGLHSSGSLIKVDGRYVATWFACPHPGYEQGPGVIGLAFSEDLYHWEVTEPILRPDPAFPWEAGGLYKAYLIRNDDLYYIFYNAKTDHPTDWHEQIGIATSPDLKTWTRYPGNPVIRHGGPKSWDARFASDPCVVRWGPWWGVYYYGFANDGHARDLLALGFDPYHLTKVPEIMLNVGPPGSIDADFAHKPSIIYANGTLYQFYCCVSGKWPHDDRAISVARSRPWPKAAQEDGAPTPSAGPSPSGL